MLAGGKDFSHIICLVDAAGKRGNMSGSRMEKSLICSWMAIVSPLVYLIAHKCTAVVFCFWVNYGAAFADRGVHVYMSSGERRAGEGRDSGAFLN